MFFRGIKKRNSRSFGITNDDHSSTSTLTSWISRQSINSSVSTREMNLARKRKRNIKFNDEVLDLFKQELKCRLDHRNTMHMLSKVENPKHKYCQLCYLRKKEKVHKSLLYCEACDVNIYINCYSIFYQEESIVAKKRKLFPY